MLASQQLSKCRRTVATQCSRKVIKAPNTMQQRHFRNVDFITPQQPHLFSTSAITQSYMTPNDSSFTHQLRIQGKAGCWSNGHRFFSSKGSSSFHSSATAASSLSDVAKLAAAGYDVAAPLSSSNDENIPTPPLFASHLKNDKNIKHHHGLLLSHEGDNLPSQKVRLDHRAKAKLLRLSEQKRAIHRTLRELKKAVAAAADEDGDIDVETSKITLEHTLKTQSEELAKAYSQAIHYVARTKEEDSASYAHRLLEEWIEQCGVPQYEYKYLDNGHVKKDKDDDNKKKDGVEGKIIQANSPTQKPTPKDKVKELLKSFNPVAALAKSKPIPDKVKALPNTTFAASLPRPEARSFHHVLLAYSDSKLRQKGFRAEQILIRMAEVSWWYPDDFASTCRPESKTFAIVAKAWSGTTHQDALDHIEVLHTLHDQFVKHNVEGFVSPSDPFLLIHSLKTKSLHQQLHRQRQAVACRTWLEQLHAIALEHADNGKKAVGQNKHNGEEPASVQDSSTSVGDTVPATPLDLTGTYMTALRGYARASRIPNGFGGYKQAFRTLRKIEHLDQLSKKSEQARQAYQIELKPNTYELILSCCIASKHPGSALSLMKELVAKHKQATLDSFSNENISDQSPLSETCFAHALQSMKHGEPTDENLKAGVQWLLEEMISFYASGADDSDKDSSTPSPVAFHALLDLYCKWYSQDATLMSRVQSVIQQMKELAKTANVESLKPDVKAKALVLKACSLAKNTHPEESMAVARSTLDSLEEEEKQLKQNLMTDEVYYYYMKCIMPKDEAIQTVADSGKGDFFKLLSQVETTFDDGDDEDEGEEGNSEEEASENERGASDPDEQASEIVHVFRACAKRGLVNSNVLSVLRSSLSDQDYTKIVGNGRLPSHWVRNVTSGKALYTDGKMGGAGKNARRKGKSTSDWKKKQQTKEENLHEKIAKKRVKKAVKQMNASRK
jgi:hypothetical protein